MTEAKSMSTRTDVYTKTKIVKRSHTVIIRYFPKETKVWVKIPVPGDQKEHFDVLQGMFGKNLRYHTDLKAAGLSGVLPGSWYGMVAEIPVRAGQHNTLSRQACRSGKGRAKGSVRGRNVPRGRSERDCVKLSPVKQQQFLYSADGNIYYLESYDLLEKRPMISTDDLVMLTTAIDSSLTRRGLIDDWMFPDPPREPCEVDVAFTQ